MVIKLICCDVFTRIICKMIAECEHIVDVTFLPMLAHEKPDRLREEIQSCINNLTSDRKYDCIVLGYGLCGNATVGLTAPIPMYIPRVHDCCTLFMGSRERFCEVFGDALSTRWSSNGYYERCHLAGRGSNVQNNIAYQTCAEYRGYVEEYGEDNAEYIWESMHPNIETNEAVYIKTAEYEFSNSMAAFCNEVEDSGKTAVVVDGDVSYISRLIDGVWEDSLFQKIMPGEMISPVYDMINVLSSTKIL